MCACSSIGLEPGQALCHESPLPSVTRTGCVLARLHVDLHARVGPEGIEPPVSFDVWVTTRCAPWRVGPVWRGLAPSPYLGVYAIVNELVLKQGREGSNLRCRFWRPESVPLDHAPWVLLR